MPVAVRVIAPPASARGVGDELRDNLTNAGFTRFRASIAYARRLGVGMIQQSLRSFVLRANTSVQLSVGIDQGVTSLEGLQQLWRLVQPDGELFVYHDPLGTDPPTFHPKVYVFEGPGIATIVVGSSNLTRGGMFTNHEAAVAMDLDLTSPDDLAILSGLNAALALHCTVGPACKRADPPLLLALHTSGELPSETTLRRTRGAQRRALGMAKTGAAKPLFGKGVRAPFPTVEAEPGGLAPIPVTPVALPAVVPIAISAPIAAGTPKTLLIQVAPQHNGEVFLSYNAVRKYPLFFGWPFTGWAAPKRIHNPAYPMAAPDPVVDIEVTDAAGALVDHERAHSLNMVDYERNHEIRITVPHRMVATIPKLSVLEMTREPTPHLDYVLRFHPPGSKEAVAAELLMKEQMPSGGRPGGGRRYGWR